MLAFFQVRCPHPYYSPPLFCCLSASPQYMENTEKKTKDFKALTEEDKKFSEEIERQARVCVSEMFVSIMARYDFNHHCIFLYKHIANISSSSDRVNKSHTFYVPVPELFCVCLFYTL